VRLTSLLTASSYSPRPTRTHAERGGSFEWITARSRQIRSSRRTTRRSVCLFTPSSICRRLATPTPTLRQCMTATKPSSQPHPTRSSPNFSVVSRSSVEFQLLWSAESVDYCNQVLLRRTVLFLDKGVLLHVVFTACCTAEFTSVNDDPLLNILGLPLQKTIELVL
jgi:hypothetical protein